MTMADPGTGAHLRADNDDFVCSGVLGRTIQAIVIMCCCIAARTLSLPLTLRQVVDGQCRCIDASDPPLVDHDHAEDEGRGTGSQQEGGTKRQYRKEVVVAGVSTKALVTGNGQGQRVVQQGRGAARVGQGRGPWIRGASSSTLLVSHQRCSTTKLAAKGHGVANFPRVP